MYNVSNTECQLVIVCHDKLLNLKEYMCKVWWSHGASMLRWIWPILECNLKNAT